MQGRQTVSHQNGAVSAGRGARCFFWLWIEPVVSTASERLTEALATASGALKDALTYLQTVMHARPGKTTIAAHSLAVLLCLPSAGRTTSGSMDQAPTTGIRRWAPHARV